MKIFKDFLLLIIGIAFVLGCIFIFAQRKIQDNIGTIKLNNKAISVEISDTDEERAQGLSGREDLALGTGMLFVFENPAIHGFWMKDMKFDIDIVWINEAGDVLGVEKNISPDTYPEVFDPDEPVKYVLELKAGEADKYIDGPCQVMIE